MIIRLRGSRLLIWRPGISRPSMPVGWVERLYPSWTRLGICGLRGIGMLGSVPAKRMKRRRKHFLIRSFSLGRRGRRSGAYDISRRKYPFNGDISV